MRGGAGAQVRVGVLGGNRLGVVRSAVERARDAGTPVTLMLDEPPDVVLRDADIMVAMQWPAFGEPQGAALAAMAARKPAVVFETELTADWPAYDPQTWRPRGAGGTPIVVSIDPRDEEHSLMVAIRELARDQVLREQIGDAAQAWWREHATVTHAADRWRALLDEARTTEPPVRGAKWPTHLTADGSGEARAILLDTGAVVDFL